MNTEKKNKDVRSTGGAFSIAMLGFLVVSFFAWFLFGKDAWSTIVFSHLTTLCAGVVLGITYTLIKLEDK
jgi:hypothetical protein